MEKIKVHYHMSDDTDDAEYIYGDQAVSYFAWCDEPRSNFLVPTTLEAVVAFQGWEEIPITDVPVSVVKHFRLLAELFPPCLVCQQPVEEGQEVASERRCHAACWPGAVNAARDVRDTNLDWGEGWWHSGDPQECWWQSG